MTKVFLLLSFLFEILFLVQALDNHRKIGFYELERANFKLNLTNYGATIVSVVTPDKHGLYCLLPTFLIIDFFLCYM